VPDLLLYLTISLSGAAVLALEILGTRILGPFYGVSLFLWSALITVTLAALSVGYALGGRWADRGPTCARLASVLAIAGVWTIVIPWIRTPLLQVTEPLGLRAAVLVASTVLFGPPLTLLGFVSPYVIRLKTRRVEEVGRTAGNIFAVSTVASVLSALATGFFLIPNVGVRRLTVFIGVVLLVAAALALLADRAARARAAIPIVLAGVVVSAIPRLSAASYPELVWAEQSAYSELRVLERDDERYLLLDGGVHTVQQISSGNALHTYAPVVDLAKNWFDAPGRLLLIGLGGGSVAASFADDGWKVDAVEIDPAVVRIAHRNFGLPYDAATIHVMDGRRFLAEAERHVAGAGGAAPTWDVIVFDAFGSSAIPFHLVTEEAFALAAKRLAPGGVLVVNVETRAWKDPIVAALAATIGRSLRHVVAAPTAEPPNTLGNLLLFATDRDPPEFPEERLMHPARALGRGWLHWATVERSHAWDSRFRPDTTGAPILTDDLNPIDVWAEEINRIARRELHDYFGSVASW
jgi:spermidine synthase